MSYKKIDPEWFDELASEKDRMDELVTQIHSEKGTSLGMTRLMVLAALAEARADGLRPKDVTREYVDKFLSVEEDDAPESPKVQN